MRFWQKLKGGIANNKTHQLYKTLMKIIRPITIVLSLFVFGFVVHAQSYEYGGTGDLKGKESVYLSPTIDFEDQGRITKALTKAKLAVKIVTDPDAADIVLSFGGSTEMVTTGASMSPSNVNLVTIPLEEGSGYVFVYGKEHMRLVMKVSNSQQSRWEKRPVTKFVEAFIKAYKEANK